MLQSNNHSVFNLNYHLVLVIKYRKKLITKDIELFLKDTFTRLSPKYNITLTEIKADRDHLHILFSAHPNSSLTIFINTYKSSTSRLVKRLFPEIKQELWKSSFWTKSFCLLSAGGAPLLVISKYIKQQGSK